MAERRMPEIVREAECFREVFVEAESPRHCPPDLRDFDAVREADAEMIAVGGDEHLRLVPQAAEGDRMNDPVAIALEDVARAARAGVRLRVKAAARL
jgi:hypothetical protein